MLLSKSEFRMLMEDLLMDYLKPSDQTLVALGAVPGGRNDRQMDLAISLIAEHTVDSVEQMFITLTDFKIISETMDAMSDNGLYPYVTASKDGVEATPVSEMKPEDDCCGQGCCNHEEKATNDASATPSAYVGNKAWENI